MIDVAHVSRAGSVRQPGGTCWWWWERVDCSTHFTGVHFIHATKHGVLGNQSAQTRSGEGSKGLGASETCWVGKDGEVVHSQSHAEGGNHLLDCLIGAEIADVASCSSEEVHSLCIPHLYDGSVEEAASIHSDDLGIERVCVGVDDDVGRHVGVGVIDVVQNLCFGP